MNKDLEIINTVLMIEDLKNNLNNLLYGSIEIRNNYIYLHSRNQTTKYLGEYNEEKYNELLNNNEVAKRIKRDLNKYEKRLKELGYIKPNINEKIKLNVDFAKKNLVNNIYDQAILEGIPTTLADTESIIDGGIIKNMKTTDIIKIVNLKHAWDFILDENVLESDTNYYLLLEINKLVIDSFYYNAGIIRSTPIKISGTKYIPPLPIESKIKEDLDIILNKKKSNLDKAIDLLLYVMKSQIFIDGNKRTAVIFANHYLISKGLGIITIPSELVDKYRKLLIEYYENKNNSIKDFLKTLCYINIK